VTDRDLLVEWLASEGFDEEDVWRFFWRVSVPPRLGGFFQICGSLIGAFDYLESFEDTMEIPGLSSSLNGWRAICRQIRVNKNLLDNELGVRFSAGLKPPKNTPPTWGQLGAYPITTALYHEAENFGSNADLTKLKGISLLCQLKALGETGCSISEYKRLEVSSPIAGHLRSSFEDMGHELRHLAYGSNKELLASVSPGSVESVETFYKLLLENQKYDPENRTIDVVKRYIERSWFGELPNNWGGGGGHSGRRRSAGRYGYGEIQPGVYTASRVNGSKSRVRKRFELPPGFLDEWQEAGENLEELFEDLFAEDGSPEFEDPSDEKVPYTAVIIRNEAERRYAGIAANHLNTQWSAFSNNEATKTVEILNSHLKSLRGQLVNDPRERKVILELEASLILMVMVSLGVPWLDAAKLVVLSASSRQRSNFAYLEDTNAWRIKIAFPSRSRRVNSEALGFVHSGCDELLLPDCYELGAVIRSLQSAHAMVLDLDSLKPKSRHKVFKINNSDLKRRARAQLKNLFSGQWRIAPTLENLPKILQRRLIALSAGDESVAQLITGVKNLGPSAQLHYTMPSAQLVEKRYLAAISSLNQESGKSSFSRLLNEDAHLTNWYLAKTEAVADYLGFLRERVSRAGGPSTLSKLVEFHNSYTAYVLVVFLLTTGYRFAVNPEADPRNITRDGVLVFGDKLSPDLYQTRLAWIPETVREQLWLYDQHRTKTLTQLISSLCIEPFDVANDVPFLFFLNEREFEPVAVRPASWGRFVSHEFPLPMNFARAYMRTRLMSAGCSIDIMRAFMGHTANGLEPFGNTSSLSPLDYIQAIRPYIEKMLGDVQFAPLKGA